jgi:AcrR family transcriptional regulator
LAKLSSVRSNSREKILDAAAHLVSEIGAGRLTLEAVAHRAGVSKGGLLYNFPSKSALLQGMVQRIIDEVCAEKDQLRSTMPEGPNAEARLVVTVLLNMRSSKTKDLASGILAASAEDPELLAPVRDIVRQTFEELKSSSDDLDAALIAWLAVEGLNSFEMHDFSPFTEQDRKRIISALGRLLRSGKI